MTSDSFLAIMLTSIIALFFGFLLTMSGYRFFLVLLPIWGFFYGFGLGAQSIQALFGEAFLASVTSWVVGFIFAVMFAMLSYLIYFFGVGVVAFALGYSVGVGILEAIGLDFGLIVWLVGALLGIVVVVATFLLNIQKYVIIVATSLLGAGVIVGTFLYLFGGLPAASLAQNPVRYALQNSPVWFLVFLVIAALGMAAQVVSTRRWEIQTYDRWSEMVAEQPPAEPAPAPQTGQPAAS
jgi:hypothetical protein